MDLYTHKVNYYETDKMGIAHHANYVRWMEEARMDFLTRIGYGMKRLEAEGVASPVVSIECRYVRPTAYDDRVDIEVWLEEYSGVRLSLAYVMTNAATGDTVLTARSTHCFTDGQGRPVALKRRLPELDGVLRGLAAVGRSAGD